MKIKPTIMAGGLLLVLAITGIGNQARGRDGEGLSVVIETSKTEVRLREKFKVSLSVENHTDGPRTFCVMSGSWDKHWKTNNPVVGWTPWDCAANHESILTLKPGEAYTKDLEMFYDKAPFAEHPGFRMGFTALGERTVWSNEILLKVIGEDRRPTVAEGEPDGISVVIKSAKTQVRIREEFEVTLSVENHTKEEQTFRVMNCSWDEHWQTDDQAVQWVGWDCAKNFMVQEKLAPGEAYVRKLQMFYDKPEKGRVGFRMGFTPGWRGAATTTWSNEVVVAVVP